MEFLVDMAIDTAALDASPDAAERRRAEASAASTLAAQGHLRRIWNRTAPSGTTTVLGLYVAADRAELQELLDGLPLRRWMDITVTPLAPHPNDPAPAGSIAPAGSGDIRLPEARLTFVFRLEATVGAALDVGETTRGRRRIVPQTGGRFTGPELSGDLVPGASADWQLVLEDGSSEADIRTTLRTDDGIVLYLRSRGGRYGPPDVLARLQRGEAVDASEYTFRTATTIETAAPHLDWLNKGVFISVGGRQPSAVIYDTYLVT